MKYMTSRTLSSRGGLFDISLIILHDDTNADRYAVCFSKGYHYH